MTGKTFVVACAVLAFCLPATPAAAFSHPGCFVPPTLHRSISAAIVNISAGLGSQGHSEARACALYARGLLYHLQGDAARAAQDYDNAIRWMHDYGDAYAARADAEEDMGRHEDAVRDYALALQYSNDSPDELTQRCWIRALRGHPLPPALEDCNQSLKAQPGDFNALSSRCLVYLRMANYAAASADCDQALDEKPHNATALFMRALARLRAGNTQGGNADLAAAKDASDRVADTFAIFGVKP